MQNKAMTVKLYAPAAYWQLSPAALAEIVNGCGPTGWKGDLIPDHLLWVKIADACDIHDYMYLVGKTEADREEADRVFLNNMLRIAEAFSANVFTRYGRRKLALHYYSVVRDYGGPYFWIDKNPGETFKNPEKVFGEGGLIFAGE
jgi:hypothetical protein